MSQKLGARIARAVRLTVALAALAAAVSPVAAQAFTLIPPVAKLYVNPKVGYTTSVVQVRGTATVNNTCTGAQLNFNFFFDGTALWNRNVSSCTANAWDTGWSPYRTPAAPRTVGKHTILLNLVNPTTNQIVATATYVYSIVQAPASPQTQTSPAQAASPSQTAAQTSPTSAACPAAMLPPSGTGSWGDTLVAGLVMFAVLPIVGLALVSPRTMLAFARRRRTLLMLLGLSVLAVFTLSCGSTEAAQPTPAALVSPASSPSCSA